LTVAATGTGSGTLTSSPAGISCGGGATKCSASFDVGSQVKLTATPAAGSVFFHWFGLACLNSQSGNTCTVTMNSAENAIASFTKLPTHTLTVTRTGDGTGTVMSSPAGIDCGSTCSHTFISGTQVTLIATNGANSDFTGWSGACTGFGDCTLTLSADQAVTANFDDTTPPPSKPVQCVVPKLKGKKLTAARTALRKHHCGVGKITKVKSTARNRGRVVAEKPNPGKRLRKGAKVALKIGRG
jgi:hypothetical protein